MTIAVQILRILEHAREFTQLGYDERGGYVIMECKFPQDSQGLVSPSIIRLSLAELRELLIDGEQEVTFTGTCRYPTYLKGKAIISLTLESASVLAGEATRVITPEVVAACAKMYRRTIESSLKVGSTFVSALIGKSKNKEKATILGPFTEIVEKDDEPNNRPLVNVSYFDGTRYSYLYFDSMDSWVSFITEKGLVYEDPGFMQSA